MAYLTAEQVREKAPALTTRGVSDDDIEDLIVEFEETAEHWIGVAFEPRTATDVVIESNPRDRVLWFPNRYLRTVTAVSVDGVAFTGDQLSAFVADDLDLIGGAGSRWGWGDKVVVSYTHGLDAPPKSLLRACRYFVRAKALDEASDKPRETTGYTDDSGFSYRVSTPDPDNGRPTGVIETDAILVRLWHQYGTPGIA